MPQRQQSALRADDLRISQDDIRETQVVTILVLTDRFEDGAQLRAAFFTCFPQAGEDEFLDACQMALQALTPEHPLH